VDFTIMRLVGWCPDLWGSASASVIGHETKKDIPMLLKNAAFLSCCPNLLRSYAIHIMRFGVSLAQKN